MRVIACLVLLAGCDLGYVNRPITGDDGGQPPSTPVPDGGTSALPDADPTVPPDASPTATPDAAVPMADAAVPMADAAVPRPDATTPMPDASAPDAAPACDNAVTTVPSGHHNAGADCLNCHNQPQGASGPFTLAGTLFAGISSSTAVSGATVHVVDKNGIEQLLVTAQNGNFWTTTAVAYPVTVKASRCPSTVVMQSQVQSSGASCNGCHGTGNRIHLP